SGDLHPLHSFPTRRSSDLNDKLVEENRRLTTLPPSPDRGPAARELAAVRDDLAKARAENERLKQSTVPATELGALQQRVTRAERSEEHTSELQSLAYLVCR